MDVRDLLRDPAETWPDDPGALPLAFVDLGSCRPRDEVAALPPFPVVGLGDRGHPLAGCLDAVIEPPVTEAAVIRRVAKNPKAASVAVGLLRALDGVPVEPALTAESLAYGLLQGSAEHAAWLAARGPARPAAPGRVRAMREGGVLRLLIDRPWALNAVDRALRDGLRDMLTAGLLDPDLSRIALRAAGRAFCVGGDLAEFGTTRDPATAHLIRARTQPAILLARCADRLDVHVQGACVGAGLEMAAFARRVTASVHAWFQLPELAMGLIPGAGGCVSVPRRIGRQRTALMILSGRRIGAATALGWGLIDAIMDEPAADQGSGDADGGE